MSRDHINSLLNLINFFSTWKSKSQPTVLKENSHFYLYDKYHEFVSNILQPQIMHSKAFISLSIYTQYVQCI